MLQNQTNQPLPRRANLIKKTLFAYTISLPPTANTRVGALITDRRGLPIAFGHNQYKTSPFQARFGRNSDSIFLHAETDCIKNALNSLSSPNPDLSSYYLWILRVKKAHPHGPFIPALSAPCLGCQRAIVTFNLRRVYYTNTLGDFARLTTG